MIQNIREEKEPRTPAIDEYEELDNLDGVALVLLSQAQEALQNKNYQQARPLLERCFQILSQKENKPALIENLAALARLAAAEGRVNQSYLTPILAAMSKKHPSLPQFI